MYGQWMYKGEKLIDNSGQSMDNGGQQMDNERTQFGEKVLKTRTKW